MTEKARSPNKTNKINNNNRRKLRTEEFSSTWMKNKWKKKLKMRAQEKLKNEWYFILLLLIEN